ncbi:acetyltransferase [Flavobacterium sp.]|uniref:acetyltransferase n=1 Tax=Flavobacterium sp. TaxID=239 RepID=UPI003342A33E
MKKVIIIGAGSQAAELEEYIFENNLIENCFQIIGYLDDSKENYNKSKLSYPLLGGIYYDKITDEIELILSINNIKLRSSIIDFYKKKNIVFSNFKHHTARVFRTAVIGEGNIICPYSQIGPNVIIGSFNTFNNKSSVGHDSIIGDNNVFCPNIGLSGNTKIGNNNFFSLNVATIPSVSVGDYNVIAPNMVIEKNIDSNSTFFQRFKERVLVIPKE